MKRKRDEEMETILKVRLNRETGHLKVEDGTEDEEELVTTWAMLNHFFMDAVNRRYDYPHCAVYKAVEEVLKTSCMQFEKEFWRDGGRVH